MFFRRRIYGTIITGTKNLWHFRSIVSVILYLLLNLYDVQRDTQVDFKERNSRSKNEQCIDQRHPPDTSLLYICHKYTSWIGKHTAAFVMEVQCNIYSIYILCMCASMYVKSILNLFPIKNNCGVQSACSYVSIISRVKQITRNNQQQHNFY